MDCWLCWPTFLALGSGFCVGVVFCLLGLLALAACIRAGQCERMTEEGDRNNGKGH